MTTRVANPDPALAVLGARLRAQRKALGLSQEALAARIGVDRTAISYWESGQVEPRSLKLAAVSRVLNISVDELLGLDGVEAA